jgi:hypothetical protein
MLPLITDFHLEVKGKTPVLKMGIKFHAEKAFNI